jgi:hypothetical protein
MDRKQVRTARRKRVVWRWLARIGPECKWRELPWGMTEQEAAAWVKAKGREIEKVEGSAEYRG